MNSGQSNQSNCQINQESQDLPQSYQPDEGSYNDPQEQQKHDQTGPQRRDRPSDEVTQAPEE